MQDQVVKQGSVDFFSCGVYPVKAELFTLHNKINPMEVLIWKFGYKASSANWPGSSSLPFKQSFN